MLIQLFHTAFSPKFQYIFLFLYFYSALFTSFISRWSLSTTPWPFWSAINIIDRSQIWDFLSTSNSHSEHELLVMWMSDSLRTFSTTVLAKLLQLYQDPVFSPSDHIVLCITTFYWHELLTEHQGFLSYHFVRLTKKLGRPAQSPPCAIFIFPNTGASFSVTTIPAINKVRSN